MKAKGVTGDGGGNGKFKPPGDALPPADADAEPPEPAKLAPLATATPEQAPAAASAAVPGTAGTPELSDEYGNDAIAIPDMMFISVSYDHRLVDGAVAARFLSAVKARLEGGDFGGEFGL